jgi:hypothetical protein
MPGGVLFVLSYHKFKYSESPFLLTNGLIYPRVYISRSDPKDKENEVNIATLWRPFLPLVKPLRSVGRSILKLMGDYPRPAAFAIVSVLALLAALVLGGWTEVWQTAAVLAFGGVAWFTFLQ